MSHPEQVSTLGPSIGWVGNTKLYRPDGSLYYDYPVSWPSSPYGFADRTGRAASVVSPPDGNGYRAPTPYWGYYKSSSINRYQATGAVKNDGTNWWPIVMTNAPVPDNELYVDQDPVYPEVASLSSAAEQAALLKFKDKRVDLSVAWLERKKTAALVEQSAMSLVKMWRDLKRLKRQAMGGTLSKEKLRVLKDTLGDLSKDMGSLWLAYRYAWTPTLLDVYGAAESVAKADLGTYNRYRVTAKAKKVLESDVTTSTDSSVTSMFELPTTKWRREHRKLEVKVRYDALLDNGLYLSLQDVGVTDPLTTAWELLPYSFVVDWFLGIGDFLEGCNALEGYSFLGGSGTIYTEQQLEIRQFPRASEVWRSDTLSGGGVKSYKAFNRTVLPAPVSKLVLKQQPLNMTRMWDSLALLQSVFHGKSTGAKPYR